MVLFSAIRAAEERRSAERFCFMEEQKIKKALAPRIWDELVANLRDQAKRIGEVSPVRLAADLRSAYELRLTNSETGRRVLLTYVPDVPCINFDGFEGGGYWPFKVNRDGTAVQLFDVQRNIVIARVSDVAFDLVRSLVA